MSEADNRTENPAMTTPAARPTLPQYGALILIGGAVFWAIALVMQIFAGGTETDSLVITVVAFVDIAIGLWALHFVQRERTGLFGVVGAALLSAGFLLFAVLRIVVGLQAGGRDAVDPASSEFFGYAALVALLGALVFGVAIHRAALFPRWSGAALIVGTLAILLVGAAEVPMIVEILAGFLMVVTLVAMAFVVLGQFRYQPPAPPLDANATPQD